MLPNGLAQEIDHPANRVSYFTGLIELVFFMETCFRKGDKIEVATPSRVGHCQTLLIHELKQNLQPLRAWGTDGHAVHEAAGPLATPSGRGHRSTPTDDSSAYHPFAYGTLLRRWRLIYRAKLQPLHARDTDFPWRLATP